MPSVVDTPESATSPWSQGQLLHLDRHRKQLLNRTIGKLAREYDLLLSGDNFSVDAVSWEAEDPADTPVKMTGTLVVPVATVRREIEKQYPGCPFSDQAALSIEREFVEYENPSLPGDGEAGADLPYDERTQEFTHTAEKFLTWKGSLKYYPRANIEGTLRLKHSVDPRKFPWLKKQAKAGGSVVLRARDYVSQHVTRLA
jgi:hypothetical protein